MEVAFYVYFYSIVGQQGLIRLYKGFCQSVCISMQGSKYKTMDCKLMYFSNDDKQNYPSVDWN